MENYIENILSNFQCGFRKGFNAQQWHDRKSQKNNG